MTVDTVDSKDFPSSLSPVPPAASKTPAPSHIRLTSHASGFGALPIHWGAATIRKWW